MKATHTDYMHPRHLRVIKDGGEVVCLSPSASTYGKLNKPGLPKWGRTEIRMEGANTVTTVYRGENQ